MRLLQLLLRQLKPLPPLLMLLRQLAQPSVLLLTQQLLLVLPLRLPLMLQLMLLVRLLPLLLLKPLLLLLPLHPPLASKHYSACRNEFISVCQIQKSHHWVVFLYLLVS